MKRLCTSCIPTSLDIRSMSIIFTSNRSLQFSSCFSSFSAKSRSNNRFVVHCKQLRWIKRGSQGFVVWFQVLTSLHRRNYGCWEHCSQSIIFPLACLEDLKLYTVPKKRKLEVLQHHKNSQYLKLEVFLFFFLKIHLDPSKKQNPQRFTRSDCEWVKWYGKRRW